MEWSLVHLGFVSPFLPPLQWECKAELDSKYKFGRIQVSCEGYDYPDDPYILRGSCGVSVEGVEGRLISWRG